MTGMFARTWLIPYIAPTVLLLASLGILFPFIDDPDMTWAMIATPLAILLGFAVRPERVWITPVAVALLIATAVVIAALMGEVEPRSSLPMLYVWTLALVGAPLVAWTWIGKAARLLLDEWRHTGSGSAITS